MKNEYADNMNIRRMNGFSLQMVAPDVWAIDEFGIDIMYLVIGSSRALLIDTGIGVGNIRAVVETVTNLPYDVINTHHHYDHAGGNGHFSSVFAQKEAIAVIQEQNTAEMRKAFFVSQKERAEYNDEASLSYDSRPLGEFEMKEAAEGDLFCLGGRTLEVIETPGHTRDGICLLDRENRLLFSGDTIVSTPTLMFDTFSDTMSSYLASLHRLWNRRSAFELIFPGHYLRPIGAIYIEHMIACIEDILSGHIMGEQESSTMTDKTVYRYQKGLASVLYTQDRVK